MSRINLYPAIVIAGPPHSGKSVLSYMLTRSLVQAQLAHYLLRAVPDGEGNWFEEGLRSRVREIKMNNKRPYSTRFIEQMTAIIQNRVVPLLVDIGGKPQANQLDILQACTHSILLYPNESEKDKWLSWLSAYPLTPIAELQSSLKEPEIITEFSPILRGIVHGLEHDPKTQKPGKTYDLLFERVSGILNYIPENVMEDHLLSAPCRVVTEEYLASVIGKKTGSAGLIWDPEDLQALQEKEAIKGDIAVYGRGPVWLAAFLSPLNEFSDFWLFDVRFGWIKTPEIRQTTTRSFSLNVEMRPYGNSGSWLECKIPGGYIDPGDIVLEKHETTTSVVLSGPLPRWCYAALTRYYTLKSGWVGIHDVGRNRVVVVFSRDSSVPLGSCLPIG
jgi:CRISPR-associated protein Csx3